MQAVARGPLPVRMAARAGRVTRRYITKMVDRGELERITIGGLLCVRASARARSPGGTVWLHCACGAVQDVTEPPELAGGWVLETATARCPACRRAQQEDGTA